MDLRIKFESLGGVKPARGAQFIPFSEPELAALEKKTGTRLPDVYRTFLTTFGACRFVQMVEFTPVEPLPASISSDGKGFINLFYGTPAHGPYELMGMLDTYKERMPEGFLPIGDDGGGDQICMMLSGEKTGKIYYWDHNSEWDEDDYLDEELPVPADLKWQNVTKIAESFEDCLERLTVRPA